MPHLRRGRANGVVHRCTKKSVLVGRHFRAGAAPQTDITRCRCDRYDMEFLLWINAMVYAAEVPTLC